MNSEVLIRAVGVIILVWLIIFTLKTFSNEDTEICNNKYSVECEK